MRLCVGAHYRRRLPRVENPRPETVVGGEMIYIKPWPV